MLAAARDFRDGLVIALLAARPIRLKNLAETEIGLHRKISAGRTLLRFRAEETKTHKPYHCVWPEPLEPALARYLEQVRPMLIAAPPTGGNIRPPGQPGSRFWVGQGGTAFSPAGLDLALRRHTKRAFGHAITAHRFRDSVATTIANDNPNRTQFAAQMLGHKRVRTTEQHYIATNSNSAFSHHHDLIASMRKASSKARRRRGEAGR